jgi:hypothetical protein
LRNPAAVNLSSPIPTAICVGPVADGTTNVCPGLPSNPAAVSAARFRPMLRGTAPLTLTGTPTASTAFGELRAMCTVTDMKDILA